MSVFKAKYYKADGSKGRARALPEDLFDGVINEPVLHQMVKAIRANRRQGTAAAKNRSAVAGGSRKPWRQKGTGRARQGTIRAAQWAGGGRAFPPQPHGWHQKVPRKVRALARRSAFNARAADDRVVLVDAFEFSEPKTSRLVGFLAGIEVEGKVLILTHGSKSNLHLSARNLPGVEVRPFGEESVYEVLWAGTVVIEREALDGGPKPSSGEAESGSESDPAPAAKAAGGKAAGAKAAGAKAAAAVSADVADTADSGGEEATEETGTAEELVETVDDVDATGEEE